MNDMQKIAMRKKRKPKEGKVQLQVSRFGTDDVTGSCVRYSQREGNRNTAGVILGSKAVHGRTSLFVTARIVLRE